MRRSAPLGLFAALTATGLGLGLGFGGLSATAAEIAPRMLLLEGVRVGSELLVVGERGTILRSSDQARTWQAAPRVAPGTLTSISFPPSPAASPRGWAVGHDALILATSDAGRTWKKQFQGDNLQDSFLDVIALDAQHVIAVGAYATYLETKDGGFTWTKRKITEDDFHFNRITQGPSGTLYLGGERGTLLRSTDAGATWTRIAAPYEGSFFGVLPLAERTLLAHGLRGQVFRSNDDGATWERIATPDPVILATAVRIQDGTIVLAGSAGTLLVSRDDGKTFLQSGSPPAKAIARLIELPGSRLLALGETGAAVIEPSPPTANSLSPGARAPTPP